MPRKWIPLFVLIAATGMPLVIHGLREGGDYLVDICAVATSIIVVLHYFIFGDTDEEDR